MTDPKAIADAYLATWNAADTPTRLGLLADGWSADACYADPLASSTGREGIAAMIDAVRAQFPGLGFTLHGQPDGHGAYARFSWALAPHGGPAVAYGTDVVRLDAAGRIADVIGFLDAVAA
jgi:hypothetical protein